MTKPEVEADWLQDALADLARRLRRPGVGPVQLADCAAILERIVGDLRGTPPLERPSALVRNPRTRWWITVAIGFVLYLLMKRLFGIGRNS